MNERMDTQCVSVFLWTPLSWVSASVPHCSGGFWLLSCAGCLETRLAGRRASQPLPLPPRPGLKGPGNQPLAILFQTSFVNGDLGRGQKRKTAPRSAGHVFKATPRVSKSVEVLFKVQQTENVLPKGP